MMRGRFALSLAFVIASTQPAAAQQHPIGALPVQAPQGLVISRTIEGFALGAAKTSAIDALQRGWGKTYSAPSFGDRDLFRLPTWINRNSAGKLSKIPTAIWLGHLDYQEVDAGQEGAYLRTDTTQYIALYFFQDRLYQISIKPLEDNPGPISNTLNAKYGKPTRDRVTEQTWDDGTTILVWDNLRVHLVYSDKQLVGMLEATLETMKGAIQRERERRQKTMPRGY